PIAGRVLPPPNGPLPRVGQGIRAGQILAHVEPPLAGPTGATVLAERAQIQTLIADLDYKLEDAETEVRKAKVVLDHERVDYERNKVLFGSKAVSVKQFKDAERDFKVADESYQGKRRAKEVFVHAREELLSMLRGPVLAQAPENPDSESPLRTLRIALRAPLS